MPWNSWVLRHATRGVRGGNPPLEWGRILGHLQNILPSRNIDKIELTAFAIKGVRTPRWLLNRSDPEYCTKNEALDVAKKLTWSMLLSRNSPRIPGGLRQSLACHETTHCRLFVGHEDRCRISGNYFNETTRCHLCKRIISLEDFDRNARKDPNAIQMGHHTPLSRTTRGHNARNTAWAHRSCNQIQSEQTLDEVIRNLKTILEANGYLVQRTL